MKNWPPDEDCLAEGCPYRRCMALSSVWCYPHTSKRFYDKAWTTVPRLDLDEILGTLIDTLNEGLREEREKRENQKTQTT